MNNDVYVYYYFAFAAPCTTCDCSMNLTSLNAIKYFLQKKYIVNNCDFVKELHLKIENKVQEIDSLIKYLSEMKVIWVFKPRFDNIILIKLQCSMTPDKNK